VQSQYSEDGEDTSADNVSEDFFRFSTLQNVLWKFYSLKVWDL